MENNIPRNTAAAMYNTWFKKEYPELFTAETKGTNLSAPPKQERTE
jgi:hypothetical protein